jgi:RecA-family ATPase
MTERSPSIQAEEIILPRFTARPWKWRDPKSISPRQWLHANHYVRKFASATIAPGGVGKTSQALVEAIGMACGRNFLGGQVAARPLAVWYWNLEDPPEEIDRRIAAILLHYNLDQTEIEGQLFINSTSDDDQLIIAVKQRDELVICHPVADALKAEMRMRAIDVMIIDPFVSCHRANENDSAAIDAVAKTWATIARNVSASVDLVHHVRKPSGASSEYTVDVPAAPDRLSALCVRPACSIECQKRKRKNPEFLSMNGAIISVWTKAKKTICGRPPKKRNGANSFPSRSTIKLKKIPETGLAS